MSLDPSTVYRIKEVKDPSISKETSEQLGASSAFSANSNAPSEHNALDDGEVEILSSTMERQSLPHQRNHCQTHPFNSQNLNRRNHFICKKCYCFVCDKPASECKEWFDPDRPDDLSAHHCNAYLSKTVIHWQTKRWLASNQFKILVNLKIQPTAAVKRKNKTLLWIFTRIFSV